MARRSSRQSRNQSLKYKRNPMAVLRRITRVPLPSLSRSLSAMTILSSITGTRLRTPLRTLYTSFKVDYSRAKMRPVNPTIEQRIQHLTQFNANQYQGRKLTTLQRPKTTEKSYGTKRVNKKTKLETKYTQNKHEPANSVKPRERVNCKKKPDKNKRNGTGSSRAYVPWCK